MNYEIVSQPDFAMLDARLEPGEVLQVEAGAMVAKSSNVQMETRARGGLLRSAGRALLGGESFFVNKFYAESGTGILQLAPGTPGDICHYRMEGAPLMVQSGSFMACEDGVEITTKWGGAKTFFGGEGLFMLRAEGEGDLFFASYGAIHEVNINGTYIVDTGHIVAFEDSLSFNVRSVGGLKSLLLSGEGLVCDFQGTGKLYLQTRSPASFVSWINPFRPVKSSSGDND